MKFDKDSLYYAKIYCPLCDKNTTHEIALGDIFVVSLCRECCTFEVLRSSTLVDNKNENQEAQNYCG